LQSIKNYFAHSIEFSDTTTWQPLSEHLENVAKRSEKFAAIFNADSWGRLLGENHDLGKGTQVWQAYIRFANNITDEFSPFYDGHPNHAFIGAKWLFTHSQEAGKLLSYCLSGHHGGLTNWNNSLQQSLAQPHPEITIPHVAPNFQKNLPIPLVTERLGFQLQFFTRMLFSCLVDADYLDTEAFLNMEKSTNRSTYTSFTTLHDTFWQNFATLREKADQTTTVNQQREFVLNDCLQAAEMNPGIFSLTVPTGGGKTLASLAFALSHAKKHKKQRIIYVIPFTSIIEQNAKVFRDILGDNAVLEHHCNFLPDDSDWQARLASENWDASIIVTTNVQFFDSFYANKPSKCRKLHNVANSIIIFDEIQAIPVEKLKPCIEVIRELSSGYGVTSVLCTATQPAITFSESFESGLNVTEIIQDIPQLFSKLKRTEEIFIGEHSEQDIANQLLEHQQVLCIVNTRQQALDIYNALPASTDNIHLSALMYPNHRSQILKEIRERLKSKNNQPCRVVSTQLIEAGVDVDFPSVFRAITGIDSIAQAAGRCNRNGKSKIPCKVSIFALPKESECSFFRLATQSSLKLLQPFAGRLTEPECIHEYFTDYFWKNEQRMDIDGILKKCNEAQSLNIQFKDIAKFRMIQSATKPVIIALEEDAIDLVNSLEFAMHKRSIFRKLQKFSVQVYPYQLHEIKDWLESPEPGIWVLRSQKLYSKVTGLKCSQPEGQAFFI